MSADALLGGEGQAFVIAQTRLGGGRIHHAMRTIGMARKALDMMCERALSRTTQGSVLADKQFVQGYIADSYAQLTQFRLLVLYTAWSIDKHKDYRKVRKDIATVKVVMPGVLHDIAQRALQVHGALGASNEMPFHQMILGASVMGIADGPTEVHKVTVARQVLRDYSPSTICGPASTSPSAWPRPCAMSPTAKPSARSSCSSAGQPAGLGPASDYRGRRSGIPRGNLRAGRRGRGYGYGFGVPDVAVVVADGAVGGERRRFRSSYQQRP